MRRTLMTVVLPGLLIGSTVRVEAGTIASEQFEYGTTAGALAGNAGGAGFSAGWVDDSLSTNPSTPWGYTPSGLSFGALDTAGGAATWSTPDQPNVGIASRPFTAPLGGTIYGGFLFLVGARTNFDGDNTAALLLGQPGDTDNTAALVMNAPQFAVPVAAQRIEGQSNDFSGESLVTGETYLALLKFDSAAVSAIGWILNLAQYENFAVGGLTESELDGASLGSGATDVFERGTFAPGGTTDPLSHLLLFGAFGGLTITYDEIRFSDSSLTEVAPLVVPEPATVALTGLGVLGLFVMVRRRARP